MAPELHRTLEIASQVLYLGLIMPYHAYLGWRLSKRSARLPTSLVLLGTPEWLLWSFAGPAPAKGSGTPHPEYGASVQVIRSVILASTFIAGLNFSTAMATLQQLQDDMKNEGLKSWHAQRTLVLSSLLFMAFTFMGIAIWAALNSTWLLGVCMYRVEGWRARPQLGQGAEHKAGQQHGHSRAVTPAHSPSAIRTSPSPPLPVGQAPPMLHQRRPTEDVMAAVATEDTTHARLLAESACLEERLDDEDVYTAQLQRQASLMHVAFSSAFRCFYLAIPVAMAAAGPVVFMVATVMQLSLLAYVDHSGPAPTRGLLSARGNGHRGNGRGQLQQHRAGNGHRPAGGSACDTFLCNPAVASAPIGCKTAECEGPRHPLLSAVGRQYGSRNLLQLSRSTEHTGRIGIEAGQDTAEASPYGPGTGLIHADDEDEDEVRLAVADDDADD